MKHERKSLRRSNSFSEGDAKKILAKDSTGGKSRFTDQSKLPEYFGEIAKIQNLSEEWLKENGPGKNDLRGGERLEEGGSLKYPGWFDFEKEPKALAKLEQDYQELGNLVRGYSYMSIGDMVKQFGSAGSVQGESFLKLFGSNAAKKKELLENLQTAKERLVIAELSKKYVVAKTQADVLGEINYGLRNEVEGLVYSKSNLEGINWEIGLERNNLQYLVGLERNNLQYLVKYFSTYGHQSWLAMERVSGLEHELAAKNEYMVRIEGNNTSLTKDLEAQVEENALLRKNIEDTEEKFRNAQITNDGFERKINDLSGENGNLKNQIGQEVNKNNIKDNKIKTLGENNQKLQDELKEVKNQLDKANKGDGLGIEELKANNRKLQDELIKMKNQVDKANNGDAQEIEALKANNQKLQDKFKETNQWFNDSMNVIENKNREIKALEANNRKLQDELAKMKDMRGKEEDRNEILKSELATSIAKNTELGENYRASQEEIEQVRAKSQETQQKLDQTRQEITDGDVIAQLDTLKKEKEDRKSILETEINSAQDEIKALLDDIKQVNQFKKDKTDILKGSDVDPKRERIQKLLELIRKEGGNVEKLAESEQRIQDLSTLLHAKFWEEVVNDQQERKLGLQLYPLDTMLQLHGRFHLTTEDFENYSSNEDILRYTKELNKEIFEGMRDTNGEIRKENLNKARSKAAEYFDCIYEPYMVVVEQKGETIKTKAEALKQLRMLKDGLALAPKLRELMTSVIKSSGLEPPQTMQEIHVEWNKIANEILEEAQTEYLNIFNQEEKTKKYGELLAGQVTRKQEQNKLVGEIEKLQKSQEALRRVLD